MSLYNKKTTSQPVFSFNIGILPIKMYSLFPLNIKNNRKWSSNTRLTAMDKLLFPSIYILLFWTQTYVIIWLSQPASLLKSSYFHRKLMVLLVVQTYYLFKTKTICRDGSKITIIYLSWLFFFQEGVVVTSGVKDKCCWLILINKRWWKFVSIWGEFSKFSMIQDL